MIGYINQVCGELKGLKEEYNLKNGMLLCILFIKCDCKSMYKIISGFIMICKLFVNYV